MDVYCATEQTVARDYLVKGPTGIYYRVQNFGVTAGGFQVLTCNDLGAGVLSSVTYTGVGTYNPATDSSSTPTPVSLSGILERYQTNYRYLVDDSGEFKAGDKIFTTPASGLASPAAGATVTISSIPYRVLGYQSDGYSSWELHLRRVV